MSLKEVTVKIRSGKELLSGAEKALRTAGNNLVDLEAENIGDSADLFSFTRDETDLGLKRGEAYGLFSALVDAIKYSNEPPTSINASAGYRSLSVRKF